jgi:hypothetical protein
MSSRLSASHPSRSLIINAKIKPSQPLLSTISHRLAAPITVTAANNSSSLRTLRSHLFNNNSCNSTAARRTFHSHTALYRPLNDSGKKAEEDKDADKDEAEEVDEADEEQAIEAADNAEEELFEGEQVKENQSYKDYLATIFPKINVPGTILRDFIFRNLATVDDLAQFSKIFPEVKLPGELPSAHRHPDELYEVVAGFLSSQVQRFLGQKLNIPPFSQFHEEDKERRKVITVRGEDEVGTLAYEQREVADLHQEEMWLLDDLKLGETEEEEQYLDEIVASLVPEKQPREFHDEEDIEEFEVRRKAGYANYIKTLKYFAEGGVNKVNEETGNFMIPPNTFLRWTWPQEWIDAEKEKKYNPNPVVPRPVHNFPAEAQIIENSEHKVRKSQLSGAVTEFQFSRALFKTKMSDVRRLYRAEYDAAMEKRLNSVKLEWAAIQKKKISLEQKKSAKKTAKKQVVAAKLAEFERDRQIRREIWRRNRLVTAYNLTKKQSKQLQYIKKEKELYWIDEENKVTESLFTTEAQTESNNVFSADLVGFWPELPKYSEPFSVQKSAAERMLGWDLSNYHSEMKLENYDDLNGQILADPRDTNEKWATVKLQKDKLQGRHDSLANSLATKLLNRKQNEEISELKWQDKVPEFWAHSREESVEYALLSEEERAVKDKELQGFVAHRRKTADEISEENRKIEESMKERAGYMQKKRAAVKAKILALKHNPFTQANRQRGADN